MKNISLSSPFPLKDALQEASLSLSSFVKAQIGYDGKIYFLFSENIPERIEGMFVNTVANSEYSALILDVDWQTETIVGQTFLPLGKHRMNFHMIQPLGESILLLGARSMYREEGPENNAAIVNRRGQVIRAFCLGDGIEDCLATRDGRIITSYFDEGIFGNYGWDNPIGASGLIVWDSQGNILWEADRDIVDCYAMNLDEKGNLWYYYYSDFLLVRTDLKNETEFDPEIEGSSGFLITTDGKGAIFQAGYHQAGRFLWTAFQDDRLTNPEPIAWTSAGEPLILADFSFRQSRALFIDSMNRLFVKQFPG